MELRDVNVSFGDKIVFRHRDFDFPDRGITLLAGPSGVGKTTLLKLLFDKYRAAGAFLFQEDRLLPWRTVEQHLLDVMPPFRRAELPGILALVELTGEEKRYPGELSGGMARRLALGRCLALTSARLFLDEPFAGVDLPRQERIMRGLRELGKPIVLTGHGQELRAWADQTIEL